MQVYTDYKHNIEKVFFDGEIKRSRLLQAGFEEDFKFCLQHDLYPITPIAINNKIILPS